jgi:hypothetical protein
MGTGFTIDSPIRVARFGISSVISLVDDVLIERIRRHYSRVYDIPYEPITTAHDDPRAARITAYLDLVQRIVARQMREIRTLPLQEDNEKSRYFEMLPETSSLKKTYRSFLALPRGSARDDLERELTEAMRPGSIDCNIMTKVDRLPRDQNGDALPSEFSDAKSALRGFARSQGGDCLVLSAGINPTLFGYMESFPEFYRDGDGRVGKGVILKVSDFRSSLVQGKFLAKKGIETREFRVESGLNCGGHAFASDGQLMGPILQEFKDRREEMAALFEPLIIQYYRKKGRDYHVSGRMRRILVTAQGGVGTHGEMRRLMETYGLDGVGWASPFLLVPEATALDNATREMLASAGEKDLYLSDASPLGVPFNNLRDSSAERWTRARIAQGRPGSSCPKRYMAVNTEYTAKPVCTVSREYIARKLKKLGYEKIPPADCQDAAVQAIYVKSCLCDQLGNGALLALREASSDLPVAICPGPNMAWFNRAYSLIELVDHIYGRCASLVPAHRPHMFVKDLTMYVDYFEKTARDHSCGDEKAESYLRRYYDNLQRGLAYYDRYGKESAFPGENLASLINAVKEQRIRLERIWQALEECRIPRQRVAIG